MNKFTILSVTLFKEHLEIILPLFSTSRFNLQVVYVCEYCESSSDTF